MPKSGQESFQLWEEYQVQRELHKTTRPGQAGKFLDLEKAPRV